MAKQKEKKEQFEGVKIVTPVFRLSWPVLFEPKAYKDRDSKEKYSIVMLYPKKCWKTEMMALRKAVDQAAMNAFGEIPEDLISPFHDGDAQEDQQGFAGNWAARADTLNAPGVFDENGEDILDKNEIYGGCYARASLIAKAWKMKDKRGNWEMGVKFYLRGIKKFKDGEKFGGAAATRHDFEDDTEMSDNENDNDGEEVNLGF